METQISQVSYNANERSANIQNLGKQLPGAHIVFFYWWENLISGEAPSQTCERGGGIRKILKVILKIYTLNLKNMLKNLNNQIPLYYKL